MNPVAGLSTALTVLWMWLALSVLWSRVLYVGVFELFWFGTLPLVFWAYQIDPDRGYLWKLIRVAAFAVATALALHACYQRFALGARPTSLFLNSNSFAALLSLVALPLAAQILKGQSLGRVGRKWFALLACFSLLVFAMALTNGRAVAMLFFAGLGTILFVLRRELSWRVAAPPVAVALLAYGAAAVDLGPAFTSRFGELQDPLRVGSMGERFLIWESTWRMVQDAPWWGIGPGMFSLVYPAYRSPADSSAGFFVHNDYLQMLLEGGIPGFLLLIAVVASAMLTGARLLRSRALDSGNRFEVTGLTIAIGATAIHSTVDFNFHVLPILILLGIMLARLVTIAVASGQMPAFRLTLAPGHIRVGKLVVSLLVLFPLLYLLSISLAVVETDRGQEMVSAGKLDEADRAFTRAYRFYPTADNALVDHADLYRHVLSVLPNDRVEEQREIFERADKFLNLAEELNPLRPLTHLVRGRLYEAQFKFTPDVKVAGEIEGAYREALRLNPRYFPAREAYVRWLLSRGRQAEARTVAEAGLREHISSYVEVVPFLGLAARLRAEAGDRQGAAEIRTLIENILVSAGWRRVAPPEARGALDAPLAGTVPPER